MLLASSKKEFTLLDIYDMEGNVCGKGATKDYKFLYINTHTEILHNFKERYCIKTCPKEPNEQLECFHGKYFDKC